MQRRGAGRTERALKLSIAERAADSVVQLGRCYNRGFAGGVSPDRVEGTGCSCFIALPGRHFIAANDAAEAADRQHGMLSCDGHVCNRGDPFCFRGELTTFGLYPCLPITSGC
jgi:hypothetical protein